MNLQTLRGRLRSHLDDANAALYKWSDSELNDAINYAVKDASVRAALTVEDEIEIPFTQTDGVWDAKYAFNVDYMDVTSVRLKSRPEIPLERTSYKFEEEFFNYRPSNATGVWAYSLDQTSVNVTTGLPERSITVIGVPSESDSILIDVIRLPDVLVDDTDIPEIDPVWQEDLVFGAAFYCFSKRDADTFDPDAAARNLAVFEMRFGERLPASVIRERQTDVPFEMIVQ